MHPALRSELLKLQGDRALSRARAAIEDDQLALHQAPEVTAGFAYAAGL
jgi:hypothetical protein